jgi:methylglyoxal synthase
MYSGGKAMTEEFNLAITAHDLKKDELIRLMDKYFGGLAGLSIIATKNTGQLIRERTGLPVRLVEDGSNGGYLQLGKMVAQGKVGMVFFLQHPLTMDFNELGIRLLLTACTIQNIPLASNLKTADFILHRFLDMKLAAMWRCPDQSVTHPGSNYCNTTILERDHYLIPSN